LENIAVIQYGLGPIGAGCARVLCERQGRGDGILPSVQLVGAVDVDPAKVGRDAGEVIGLGKSLALPVCASLKEALSRGDGILPSHSQAVAAVHSTGSSLRAVLPQLEECMRAGLNVVSTCEELAYPAAQHPELPPHLDSLAKASGVTILGTGINPGYAMDALALFLSGACQRVESVSIRRVVDASRRRLPLQKKIGAGLSGQEFDALVSAGKVRHVGLIESVALLAAGLGWSLDRIDETISPVLADRELRSEYLTVAPGQAAGVRQIARGFIGDREVINLDLCMALWVETPGDFIHLRGEQDVELAVKGIHGDLATAAVVANALPRVVEAAPGLLTMKDIAIPACRSHGR